MAMDSDTVAVDPVVSLVPRVHDDIIVNAADMTMMSSCALARTFPRPVGVSSPRWHSRVHRSRGAHQPGQHCGLWCVLRLVVPGDHCARAAL